MVHLFFSFSCIFVIACMVETNTSNLPLELISKATRSITDSKRSGTDSNTVWSISRATKYSASHGGTRRTFQPQELLRYILCCLYGTVQLPRSSTILQLKVDTTTNCWNYCMLTRGCALFSYQFVTGMCSLHNHTELIFHRSTSFNLAVLDMECLDCLGEIADVVKLSKAGVQIKHVFTGKCLTTSSEKMEWDGLKGYQLTWRNCSRAARWIVTWADIWKKLVRISQLDSKWGIDWTRGEQKVAYLTKEKNINNQGLLLERKGLNGCLYRVLGPEEIDDTGKVVRWIIFSTRPYNDSNIKFNYTLNKIKIIPPIPGPVCPLRQFAVKHGRVLNDNNVPFFLPGSTVTVQCNAGYGVKTLNKSVDQELKCSVNARPKRCIKSVGLEKEWTSQQNVYLAIIASLVTLLILCAAFYPYRQNVCLRCIHRNTQSNTLGDVVLTNMTNSTRNATVNSHIHVTNRSNNCVQ